MWCSLRVFKGICKEIIQHTLPYVRTGGFGNYDYTLIESSMYVPVKNYSTKGTTAYSINGVKVEYRTTSGLFGTDKTVTINDGNKYTSVSHDGEQIWYR